MYNRDSRLAIGQDTVYRGVPGIAEKSPRLEVGGLLVGEGHGIAHEIGKVAVWDGSIPEVTHQNHLIRVRCHDVIHQQFAAYYLDPLESVGTFFARRRQRRD